MKYNKLVRDKIPGIIRKKGEVAKIHIADNEEYFEKLKEKLKEEVEEFLKARGPNELNELADISEVIDAICSFRKITKAKLAKTKKKKALERGAFKKRIILEES